LYMTAKCSKTELHSSHCRTIFNLLMAHVGKSAVNIRAAGLTVEKLMYVGTLD
jgi:hypothetical protein